MSGAFVVLFLLFALVIPLALWVAIENETSNPTVVDREEAEQVAQERGGRNPSAGRSSPRSDSAAGRDRWNGGDERDADHRDADHRGVRSTTADAETDEWGSRRD